MEAIYTYEGSYEINTLVAGRDLTGLAAFTKWLYDICDDSRPLCLYLNEALEGRISWNRTACREEKGYWIWGQDQPQEGSPAEVEGSSSSCQCHCCLGCWMSGKTSRILHQFPLIKTRSSQKTRSKRVEKTRALRRRGWRDWNLNRIVRTWRDIYKVDGAAIDPKRRTTEVLSVGGVELDGQSVWKWNQWNSGRWYGTRKDHPNYIDAGFYEIVQRSFRATYCHRT